MLLGPRVVSFQCVDRPFEMKLFSLLKYSLILVGQIWPQDVALGGTVGLKNGLKVSIECGLLGQMGHSGCGGRGAL